MARLKMGAEGYAVFKRIMSEVKSFNSKCMIFDEKLFGIISKFIYFSVSLDECDILDSDGRLAFVHSGAVQDSFETFGNRSDHVNLFLSDQVPDVIVISDDHTEQRIHQETSFIDEYRNIEDIYCQHGINIRTVDEDFVRLFGVLLKSRDKNMPRLKVFFQFDVIEGCQVLGFENLFGKVGFDEQSSAQLQRMNQIFSVYSSSFGLTDYQKIDFFLRKVKINPLDSKLDDFILFSRQHITEATCFHVAEIISSETCSELSCEDAEEDINKETWLIHK